MNITIHSIRFTADAKLEQFITNKLKKLSHFYDNILNSEVFLRLDKSQNLENKIVEIKLDIKGNDLFAKKQSKTFEEATDHVINALKKQLKKHKEKLRGI